VDTNYAESDALGLFSCAGIEEHVRYEMRVNGQTLPPYDRLPGSDPVTRHDPRIPLGLI
jgi:hypothetical protein